MSSGISVWFDNWCPISSLAQLISGRDIYGASFQLSSKVNEIIVNGNWGWPKLWYLKFPDIAMLNVPILYPNSVDVIIWIDHDNNESGFSVAKVWDCIRPRGTVVNWYHLVWFSYQIARHAIHLWLVIKRKLKTQDTLRQWDVSRNTNLNLLRCSLCETQPDSHDHLFFECSFSLQVLEQMRSMIGIPNMLSSLDLIVNFFISIVKKRSARSIIAKHVFTASCYFIWQERNDRLFAKKKRIHDQFIDAIKSTIRLKLLTCKFKKTMVVQMLLQWWKLPYSLIRYS
nr:hypothetical protein [Tanacetum cinerariifolium]